MSIQGVSSLQDVIDSICAIDIDTVMKFQAHLDMLTKPIGSLGRLESIAARMMAILSGQIDLPLKKAVYVFAADHGITDEGVSAYPRAVTVQMVSNFLSGGAGINVLCRAHAVDISIIDVGIDAVLEESPGLVIRKVCRGTRNMLHEPAMTTGELQKALSIGMEMAISAHEQGCNLMAAGEMGIGNTTAASAITAILTRSQPENVTGKGTGLAAGAVLQKAAIIRAVFDRHFKSMVNPDPLELLRCVGGLEIAAIAGFVLCAASLKIPVVLDGFITTAAAAIAYAIEPKIKDYLFAGHISEEPGHRYLLDYLGLEPILSLGMRLGEGTGAVLAMPVIESSLHLYHEMATFASAGVSTATR